MSLPLSGRSIVNTRSRDQAEALDTLLRVRGALPIAYPTVSIRPAHDSAPLEAALADLGRGAFDWLLLTSANAVRALRDRAPTLALDLVTGGCRVAVVGEVTAAAARTAGFPVAFVSGRATGRALAETVPLRSGDRILLPTSDRARPEAAPRLRERGAQVVEVIAYRTGTGHGGDDLPQLLATGAIDALTFASTSAVEGLFVRLAAEGGSTEHAVRLPCVCIGPGTLATARERGLRAMSPDTDIGLESMVNTLELMLGANGKETAPW